MAKIIPWKHYWSWPQRSEAVSWVFEVMYNWLHFKTDFSRFSYCCTVTSAIGIIICLSICNTVHCGLGIGVDCQKLYSHVPSRQLPVNVFRHCRMYHLATKHSKKWTNNKVSITSWYLTGAATVSSRQFGSAAVPHIVCSMIGLLSDSYALVVRCACVFTNSC